MKKHTIILLAGLLWSGIPSLAQVGYMKDINVNSKQVVRNGQTVDVSMQLGLDDMKMKRQHTVELVPVLVAKDGVHEAKLPSVVINGSIRDRAIHRTEVLDGETYYAEAVQSVKRRNGEAQAIDYQASAPFEQWMYDSRLEIRESVTGCAECGEGSETAVIDPLVLPRFVPDYLLTMREPAPEPVKRRDEVRSARLQFKQDSYRILLEYRNNQAELDSVQHSLDVVKNNADLTITGIYVTGYASPEGTVPYNLKLSERRAKTFTEYIQQRNPDIDRALWHVDWKGEDWEGLRAEVEKYPNLLKQDEVLAIIDGCDGDRDACEEQLKALIPPTIYQRLLNEMYVPLRRNEYRIEYNVRNFNIEEAKQLMQTQPELVSLNEMYKVAGTYTKGSSEYNKAMQIAATTYPDQPVALGNAAIALIENGQPEAAIQLLEGKTLDTAARNTLGVAYAQTGQYEQARATLEQAANEGNTEARENLSQLLKVIEQL